MIDVKSTGFLYNKSIPLSPGLQQHKELQ